MDFSCILHSQNPLLVGEGTKGSKDALTRTRKKDSISVLFVWRLGHWHTCKKGNPEDKKALATLR